MIQIFPVILKCIVREKINVGWQLLLFQRTKYIMPLHFGDCRVSRMLLLWWLCFYIYSMILSCSVWHSVLSICTVLPLSWYRWMFHGLVYYSKCLLCLDGHSSLWIWGLFWNLWVLFYNWLSLEFIIIELVTSKGILLLWFFLRFLNFCVDIYDFALISLVIVL